MPDAFLLSLTLPPSYRGFAYLCTALELLEADPGLLHGTIKRLYPEISRRHPGSTVPQIERAVRTAFAVIWRRCPPARLEQILGRPPDAQPKPREFLAYLFRDYSRRS